MYEMPSLEELYGWQYDENDDSPIVTETDVDDDSDARRDYLNTYDEWVVWARYEDVA